MANEFKHLSVGGEITQAEYEAVGGHLLDSQAVGDIIHATTTAQLSRLGIGSENDVLNVSSGGLPEWGSTLAGLTLTAPTINGVVGGTQTSATITALTISSMAGNWTNAGRTVADMGIVTTIDINGGTINGITDLAVVDGGTGASTLNNLITMGTHTTGNYVATVTAGTGLTSDGATSGESITHSLSVDASQGQITTVGALNAGSIGTSFGVINNNAAITGTAVTGTSIVGGTVAGTTAAFSGLITANGGITFAAGDDIAFTGGTGTNDIVLANGLADALSITDGSADVIAISTAGSTNTVAITGDLTVSGTIAADTATVATTVTVTDNESTNEANAIIFTAGGDLDGGNLGLESDGTLNYNPSTGTLTTTVFVGALTGNVTGNASGTAATVTGGTQASITSTANLVTVGTIGTGVWQGTAIASGYIAADAITGAKIADDAIDSEHYTDGSIDNAHIADNAIDSEHYADGSIDNAHIADDAIDSEHYVDGSIDNAHIADDAIDSEHYAAGSIDTAHIADNQVTVAKLVDLARGSLIIGNASAASTELTKGADGYVLTSDGDDIAWAASTVGDITSIVAGTGLTGSSLTSGDATVNVIGGTGITANANDIAIDSTVTTLTGSQTLTNKTLTAPTLTAPALGTPASGVMTNMTGAVTASILDNQVTVAKLADIARGSLIVGNASAASAELTKGGAATVLTSDGTDIAWAAAGGGGIQEADMFTLVTGLVGESNPITANLVRVANAGFAKISEGDGVAVSGGVYTFPSTGIYEVTYHCAWWIANGDTADPSVTGSIDVTLNASSGNTYAPVAHGNSHTSAHNQYASAMSTVLVDCTATADVKVRLTTRCSGDVQTIGGGGGTGASYVWVLFKRLGDTS